MIHDVYPVYCFANLVNAGSSHGERPKLPSSLSNNNEPRSQSDPQNLRSKVLTRSPAYCWEEAQGFPKSVVDVFQFSPFELFHSLEFILGSLLRILRPRHTLR